MSAFPDDEKEEVALAAVKRLRQDRGGRAIDPRLHWGSLPESVRWNERVLKAAGLVLLAR